MRVLFLSLFIFIAKIAIGQTHHDERLTVKYASKYLDRMEEKSPVIYQRINYYLDHSYMIIDNPNGKFDQLKDEISIQNLDEINILELERAFDIQPDYKMRRVFRIKGTDKVLVRLPMEEFNEAFNQFRKTYRED